jgi:hypothetical protein
MEREDVDRGESPRSDDIPDGWELVSRFDGPTGTVLRLVRTNANPARHWVTALGTTYEDALRAGKARARLYDELDRTREA